ncbi:radical SAM family heme chaperone HemW [Primorskyibacter sp. S187A]|uniref:radical SAM family heme chaperone HemW n=1 Tax=Primorskyibacter sp. S187A TaxID=3415130 RepID=UPI003C7BC66B
MPEPWQTGGFGAYIHWPYCEAKCPYCDFNSHVTRFIDHTAWRDAYSAEIDLIASRLPDRVLTSVFFGGGTPSLMEPRTIETVLDRLSSHYTFTNNIEITLEANPSSVEAAKFSDFRSAGINRVSLGVQALNDYDLKRLGRLHSLEDAMQALDIAQSTFQRVSFDLIYARQDQTEEDWAKELTQALSREPDHLSLYQLTIEKGTAFGDRFAAGKLGGLPTDAQSSDMYFITQDLCEQAGLPAYEVSNHAKKGAESRHNLIYWNSGDFLGIGPGAHGRYTNNGQRFETATELSPQNWLRLSNSGRATTTAVIAPDDWGLEMVLMGLRLSEPLYLDRLEQETGLKINNQRIKSLAADGLLEHGDSWIKVTPKGRPLLNAVLVELLRD